MSQLSNLKKMTDTIEIIILYMCRHTTTQPLDADDNSAVSYRRSRQFSTTIQQ